MTERWIVAKLRLDTALHVGKGKGNKPTDSPLRRTGDGRLVLPGRAIGGALRTTATRLAPRLQLLNDRKLLVCKSIKPSSDDEPSGQGPCGCLVCQLFGELYPSELDAEEGGGRASRLWVSDAFARADPQTHVRDGIGLMRDRGTAARNVKFDFETAPRGTTFSVRLRVVEDDDDGSPAPTARSRLLAATLAEWEAGRARLGSGAARGLGAVTLCDVRHLRTALSSADELIDYLKAREHWSLGQDDAEFWRGALIDAREAVSAVDEDISVARGFVSVEFTIETEGPFLSNDPLVALLSGFDHAPQLSVAVGGPGEPFISGGSLRGALRARAEKIARTLWSLRWQSQQDFLAHCPACLPMARHPLEPLSNCDSRIQTPATKEVVNDDDLCLGCRLFGSTRQGSRLWVDDAHWAGSELNDGAWKAQDFLAIDRFTGGGQEGAKFDAAPLVKAKFTGRLTLHSPQGWELGWLALVLRDLCDGQITLGFGAAKGYGHVRAKDLVWQVGTLTSNDFPGSVELLAGGVRSGIHLVAARTSAEMTSQLQDWLTEFLALRDRGLTRRESDPPQADTFFGRPAESLYGLPRSGR